MKEAAIKIKILIGTTEVKTMMTMIPSKRTMK